MRDAVAQALRANWPSLTRPRAGEIWPLVLGHLYEAKFAAEWAAARPGERDVLRKIVAEVGATGQVVRGSDLRAINRGLVARLGKKSLLARAVRGEYLLYHPLFGEYVRGRGKGRRPAAACGGLGPAGCPYRRCLAIMDSTNA